MKKVFGLDNKTILITGASSGIGRVCAIECSKAGATVIASGRNEDRLAATMSQIDERKEHRSLCLDLTNYPVVDQVMKSLEDENVKIDGVVHSAGISTTLPLRVITPEKMQSFFDTNVSAAIYLSRWITKRSLMPESGTNIVFLSSVMGSVGESGKTIYSLTKGALLAATRSLAVELADKNVRVNCISPGVVDSPMSKSAIYSRSEEALTEIKKLHPLGLGTPEDVAYAVIFLLSEASRWVTGSNLFVDGGYTAR